MLRKHLTIVVGVVGLVLQAPAEATVIDLESIAPETLVRDQFVSVGLRVSGVGPFSGFVFLVGQYDTAPFGGSGTHIMHIGGREQSTTLQFVDPSNPGSIVGAYSVGFLMGDGDPDLETFRVVIRDPAGSVIAGPLVYDTDGAPGVPLQFDHTSLGSLIGSVELTLAASSASGIALDDIDFALSQATTHVPDRSSISTWGKVRALYR